MKSIRHWAAPAIQALQRGDHFMLTAPSGNSMLPKIRPGDLVELEPVDDFTQLEVGDIVLVKVRGTIYLHLIRAIENKRVQIANNHGRINGWTARRNVYGRAVRVRRA